MRILFLILFATALLSAQTSTPSVCIEDGMSLRSEPAKSSKFITTVGLGEEVTWLGRTEKDAMSSQDYYDIKLSDGTTGWILTRGIVTKAKAGVIRAHASVFTRPNLLNSTDKSLEPLALIAILQKQSDGWMEVVEGKLDAPSGEHVWVKDPEVSIDKNDVALAVIAAKVMREKDEVKKKTLIASVTSNSALSTASLFQSFANSVGIAEENGSDTCIIGEARVGQKFRNFTLVYDQHATNLDWIDMKFAGSAMLTGKINYSDFGGIIELVLNDGKDQLPIISQCKSCMDGQLRFRQIYPYSPIVETWQETNLRVGVDTLSCSKIPMEPGAGGALSVSELTVLGTVQYNETVCIESEMSMRELPSNRSALLTKLKIGESVQWLGETKQVSGLDYWKIRTSTGISGWTLGRCLVTGASPKILAEKCTGVSKLDGKTFDFPAGTVIAVLNYVLWGTGVNQVFFIPCEANDAKKNVYKVLNPKFAGPEKSDTKAMTLAGHSDLVFSVAFSADGKLALSGSKDKTLKLWDIATGKEIITFAGHTDEVNSVAFSPDGKLALSGSNDKTLKIWEIRTGKEIKTFTGHSSWVRSVAFSPDGELALSGSEDKTLKLWDVRTGKDIETFTGHSREVCSVAFSRDGKRALSGSYDNTLKLWEVSTGKEIKTFFGHSRAVTSVAISPDGKLVLSGSFENTLKLWDVSPGKEIKTFTGHSDIVMSVAFSPDGRLALSGSNDKTLKLWEVNP